ncbi:MAG: F-box protein [Thermoplasmata archaeon]
MEDFIYEISKKKLCQIKKLTLDSFCLKCHITKKAICLCADILLYIISYLSISEILVLRKVCKVFYGICQTNYVWKSILFEKDFGATKTMMDIIYKNNRMYFCNYFYFLNYINITETPKYYSNYLELFKNISDLIPDLCPPYHHREVFLAIKQFYCKIMENIYRFDNEFIYTIRVVDDLSPYENGNYFWKYKILTNNSDILFILSEDCNGRIKMEKIVRPFNVPAEMIKHTTIVFFRETIDRMLETAQY